MNKTHDIARDFTSADGRQFKVSYRRIHGKTPGPTLTLIAGQHGMEHIGPVMLKDLARELIGTDFAGTVNICACANPLALEKDYEFYPEKEDVSKIDDYFYSIFRHDYCIFSMERQKGVNLYNMNRLWNRPAIHGTAGAITDWLWQEIVSPANLTIDFHCLQAEKPLIFNWNPKNLPIATAFGAEAIYPHRAVDEFNQGNLAFQACREPGKFAFCVEFSRQHGYKDEFDFGRQGVLNVMKTIGMLPGTVQLERDVYQVNEDVPWHKLESSAVGHIHYHVKQYDAVKQGDPILSVSSLENFEVLDCLRAPVDGILGFLGKRPVSGSDEALAFILECTRLATAGVPLEKFPLQA